MPPRLLLTGCTATIVGLLITVVTLLIRFDDSVPAHSPHATHAGRTNTRTTICIRCAGQSDRYTCRQSASPLLHVQSDNDKNGRQGKADNK
ncbi:hypothetical protein FJZ28_01865 [Candidatus Peregrinibacteria bacterium]|nr:hypothetical protein [Candidatus Peregrinibacteria bacterium]